MRRYLLQIGLMLIGGLALVAGTNFLIDPYDVWHGKRIAGINAYKPSVGRHLRPAKLQQAMRADAAILIAGNSRVGVGIDPASGSWRDGGAAYNLGLAGNGLSSVAAAVTTIAKARQPVFVYFGLDFLDFRLTAADRAAGFPASPEPGVQHPRDYLELLLSLDATGDSLATLAEQRRSNAVDLRPDGYNSLAEFNDTVAAEGHYALFQQREGENVARLLANGESYGGGADDMANTRLSAFLHDMRARKVDVVLFTYPYHAELLAAFDAAGLWPEFERWKRDLADIASAAGVPLWDFAVLTAETSETVPAAGDTRTRMHYYWEAGHFKAALGDLVMARMTGSAGSFGTLLTPGTVDAVIKGERQALAAYKAENPEIAARLAGRVESSRKGKALN
jgi:hypothetical protein